MVGAGPEVVLPAITPIRTDLMRIIFVLKVRVSLALLTGLHVARVKSIHQIHLHHHWLSVFLLNLVDVHLLIIDEVITLLNELSISSIFPILLQADLGVVPFTRRSHLIIVRLQIGFICNQFLRNARLVVLVRLQVIVLLLIL